MISNTVYLTHLGKGCSKSDGELFDKTNPFHCVDKASTCWDDHCGKHRQNCTLLVVFDGPGTFCLDKCCYENMSFTNPHATVEDVVLIFNVKEKCPITLRNISFNNITIRININAEEGPHIIYEGIINIENSVLETTITPPETRSRACNNTLTLTSTSASTISSTKPSVITFQVPLKYSTESKDCICSRPDSVLIYEKPFTIILPQTDINGLLAPSIFHTRPNTVVNSNNMETYVNSLGNARKIYMLNEGTLNTIIPDSTSNAAFIGIYNINNGIVTIFPRVIPTGEDASTLRIADWPNSALVLSTNSNVIINMASYSLQNFTQVATGGGIVPAPPPVITRNDLNNALLPLPILFQYVGTDNPAGVGYPSHFLFNDATFTNLTNRQMLLTNVYNYRGTFNLNGPIIATGQTLLDNRTGPIYGLLDDASVVTNGSVFLLYRTITENYTHTMNDGQIFHIDATGGASGTSVRLNSGGSNDNRAHNTLTITLPKDPLWNGRILKYKRIDCNECRGVVLISEACFDGSVRCIYLDPFDAIELQNRGGNYVILSRYVQRKKKKSEDCKPCKKR